jgi:hypothetical protein
VAGDFSGGQAGQDVAQAQRLIDDDDTAGEQE